jgi:putative membrane protein
LHLQIKNRIETNKKKRENVRNFIRISMVNPGTGCMADIMAVAYYKRIADWKIVAKLLPTALLGFLVALFVDKLVPAQGFRKLMGWTLALAMAVMIWSEIFGKENRWMHKWWYSALFGLLGGFTILNFV